MPPVSGLSKSTMRAALDAKALARSMQERVVGRVVRPERERSARSQVTGCGAQPRGRVQIAVAVGEPVARRVVDVDQDRVVARAVGRRLGAHEREEVVLDEHRARVVDQLGRDRQQLAPCQSMTAGSVSTTVSVATRGSCERGHRRVAEPEAADEHVQLVAVDDAETAPRELLLGDREQARHQVLVAELHLVHVDVEHRLVPSPQRQLPHRGGLEIELLEPGAHVVRAAAEHRAQDEGGGPEQQHASQHAAARSSPTGAGGAAGCTK